jgi:hypothetical protein
METKTTICRLMSKYNFEIFPKDYKLTMGCTLPYEPVDPIKLVFK